jgi:hypothetical protein
MFAHNEGQNVTIFQLVHFSKFFPLTGNYNGWMIAGIYPDIEYEALPCTENRPKFSYIENSNIVMF